MEKPTIPEGMREVTKEEFYAALMAETRDIMPRCASPEFTVWELQRTRAIWGWSAPGYKYPNNPEAYALAN